MTASKKADTTKKAANTKPAAKKPVAKKAATTKTAEKKVSAKAVTTKKAPAKKAAASTTKKATEAKKANVKKTSTKKAPVAAKKAPSKKAPTKAAKSTTASVKDLSDKVQAKGKKAANEEYMSAEQLAFFKSALVEWRDNLMQEVDNTISHMKDEAANFPDPADRATQEEEFSLELRTRDRERKLIKKIEKTLDRIDDDDYGYCDSCGVEIGFERLKARLTATECIDCKTLAEIKEKQERG